MNDLQRAADRAVVRVRSLAASVLAVLVVALTFLALLLFARGAAGFFVEPLGFVTALATGLLAGMASWILRASANRVALAKVQRKSLLALAVVAPWLLMLGLTCSPMTSLAVLALWLPMVAMESAWWVLPPEAPLLTLTQEHAVPALALAPLSWAAVEMDANVVQQFIRTQHDGAELLQGIANVEFAAEEQTAVLHLSFSPPLLRDPDVTITAMSMAGVTVKATECRSYGLRLEAKRGRETTLPLTMRVAYEARA